MHCTVGVDIGGTTTKAVLVDASGRTLKTRRVGTPGPDRAAGADSVDQIVETVAALVKELIDAAPHRVTAVGVAVPGVVDEARGTAVWSENLRWRDVPFADLLAQRDRLARDQDVVAVVQADQRRCGDGGHGFSLSPSAL